MQALGGIAGQGSKLRKAPRHFRRLGVYVLCCLLYQALVIAMVFLVARFLVPGLYTVPALYLAFLLVFLFLGGVHAWLEDQYLPQIHQGGLGFRLLFCLVLMTTGALLLAVGTRLLFGPTRLSVVFAATTLLMPVPLLAREAYRRWLAIPEPLFRPWWLPVDRPAPDIDLVDLSTIQVIRFEFRREPTDPTRADSRAKAPVYMSLGDLFHVFLTDYNERFSAQPIRLFDRDQKSFGWVFFIRPRFWWQSRRYLDPSLNFNQNRIRDSDRVVAHRVGNE
ncbi:TssN family type VI secretion system protein [Larkinella soli]|uniref:TssN family type VI secretion system protein n=1 Tax=Larkinella soli TaxID=1770527 RepID=UPI000FFBEF43|nr:TssN family type VI secretion system protein [Larkinella soli]